MSINPVQGIGPAGEAQLADANLRPQPTRSEGEGSAQPNPGTAPKQDTAIRESAPVSDEMPQDEVQVQRDSGTDDEIVIKYVDHSGNVILQMPSSEVLGLARAISEDFQQQAKARAASGPETGEEGEKTHGH